MGAATLACAIMGTLMVIVFPAVTKQIIDEVLNQHRPERLTPLVLIVSLFNDRRRCLHDMLVGTIVINNAVRASSLRATARRA